MVPLVVVIGAYDVGGAAMVCNLTTSNIGTLNATLFSVQPMQGAPMPMGHTSGISLKWRVEHPACVSGPLHPIS
jgi:hypothetical protein